MIDADLHAADAFEAGVLLHRDFELLDVESDMLALLGKLCIDQVRDDLPQVLNRGVFHVQQEGVTARELEDFIHILDSHRHMILVREKVLHH